MTADNRTPSDLPLTAEEVEQIRRCHRPLDTSARTECECCGNVWPCDAARLLAARATVSAGPECSDPLTCEHVHPEALGLAARPVSAEDDRPLDAPRWLNLDERAELESLRRLAKHLATPAVSAGDDRQRLAALIAEHRYSISLRRCACGAEYHPDYEALHLAEVVLAHGVSLATGDDRLREAARRVVREGRAVNVPDGLVFALAALDDALTSPASTEAPTDG